MNVSNQINLRLRCLAVVLLFLAGCSGEVGAPPPVPPPNKPYKNLVLIAVDSLRADLLDLKGLKYPPLAMTKKLADQSVVFENAFAQGTTPAASYMSMMTGTHVRTHGVDLPDGEALPRAGVCGRGDLTFLAEALKQNGFETAASVSTRQLPPKLGFPRGFATWNRADIPSLTAMRYLSDYRQMRPLSDKTVREVAKASIAGWAADGGKHFLYVHFAGPELPYAPSETARSFLNMGADKVRYDAEKIASIVEKGDPKKKAHVRLAYLAEMWEVDGHIYNLLHELKKQGVADDTIVVITGNRGVRFFAPTLTGVEDIFARVPLIVHLPGQAPRTVRRPVGHIDIAPTMLRLLGVATTPKGWQGTDLFAETGRPVVTQRLLEMAVHVGPTVGMAFDAVGTPSPLNAEPVPAGGERSRLMAAYQQWLQLATPAHPDASRSPSGICSEVK